MISDFIAGVEPLSSPPFLQLLLALLVGEGVVVEGSRLGKLCCGDAVAVKVASSRTIGSGLTLTKMSLARLRMLRRWRRRKRSCWRWDR